jgi:hypothetical protein
MLPVRLDLSEVIMYHPAVASCRLTYHDVTKAYIRFRTWYPGTNANEETDAESWEFMYHFDKGCSG